MIHDAWLEQGAKEFEERLQEKTKEMMAPRPHPLPAEIRRELDQMAKHWK
jgi:trimethylamine:corrinoid methyltransferase-like protein